MMRNSKQTTGYHVRPFPRMRRLVVGQAWLAQRKHMIRGLIEVDVTTARQAIRDHQAATGERLSFTASEQKLPVPIWVYQALFSSDFPYWVLQHVAHSSLEPMFDITPALRAAAPPEEQPFIASMVDAFQPVTARIDGVKNEGAAVEPSAVYRVETITASTLVVHARDDHLNPFSFGEYTAQHIAGAQGLPLASGGHLLLGHHAEVKARATAFLRQYAVGAK